jgi:hypothetical protein
VQSVHSICPVKTGGAGSNEGLEHKFIANGKIYHSELNAKDQIFPKKFSKSSFLGYLSRPYPVTLFAAIFVAKRALSSKDLLKPSSPN